MSASVFAHITADQVRGIREVSGLGVEEVKRQLKDEAALAALGELEVEEIIDPRLAEVLQYLLARGRS